MFRAAQAFGVLAVLGVWAWKWLTHHDHFHANVFVMAVTWAVATELGYQVGRSSKQ